MCYWPTFSDTIPPDLELGWPDRDSWAQPGGVHIYTNPPMPQTPPIREVIRRLIQGARKVIAIVTDRLTDSLIINDLCIAASHGVPVYIILNHRSAQDTDPPHKLRHPNIRVRILEGKSFCSREGKMVTGELRESFFMFDLEAVMLGSYSPTWSDAHLHRQLVVLLTGPVVMSFDQEFRILYAASLPTPDTLLVAPPLKRRTSDRACPQYKPHHQLNGLSPICDMTSPPPSDFIVDWDSLGLTNYKFSIDEAVSPPWQWRDPSLGLPPLVEKNMSVQRRLQRSGAHFWMDQPKVHHESLCRRTNQLSSEKKETTPREEPLSRSTNQRANEEGLPMSHRKGSFLEQGLNFEFDISSGVSKRVPKKALILSVAENRSYSRISDVLKTLQGQGRCFSQQVDTTRTLPGINKFQLDQNFQEEHPPDNQLKTNSHTTGHVTPAQSLMRHRTEEIRPGVSRAPRTFLDGGRPRSSSITLPRERWKFLNSLKHDTKK
ncbi:protein FAM83A isoform X2 [Paramormyrops kingsleyae]